MFHFRLIYTYNYGQKFFFITQGKLCSMEILHLFYRAHFVQETLIVENCILNTLYGRELVYVIRLCIFPQARRKLLKNRHSEYSNQIGSVQRLTQSVLSFGDQEVCALYSICNILLDLSYSLNIYL